MLGAAVQKNKAAQQQGQSKPLAKQIFSSSPPTQGPRPAAAPFARAGSNGGQPLKSASLSRINGLSQSDKPLKRAISSISTNSHGSAASRSFSSQQKQQTMAATGSSKSSGLHKLHQDISFDENDFCDDADINLDDPMPEQYPLNPAQQSVTYPSLPSFESVYPQNEPQYPTLPEVPARTPTGKQSQSSAPLPWSSSSPLPQVKPMDLHQFRRPTQPRSAAPPPAAQPSVKAPPVEVIDLETEEPERPAKRRTWPWLIQPQDSQGEPYSTGSARMKRPKKETEMSLQTPVPKKTDMYPWNQTASAVKAEQKKHRSEVGGPTTRKTKARNLEDDDLLTLRKAKTTKKTIAPVFLSDEQQKVLKLVVEDKKSVFFTGSAGTGKSVLMREIIAKLRQIYKNEPDRVAVTASTGLAACNIGGNTLHSFAGIGLGKESHQELTKKIRRNQKTVQRWQRTKVLIIDEVSMIDAALLDKLDQIARALRRKGGPFGGIQLVITGDFFQLPPVTQDGAGPRFAFDAEAWRATLDATIGLTQVFRQRDPAFATMLNEMRVGKLSPTTINEFRKLARPLKNAEGTVEVEATELFPTRQEVERANRSRLDRLAGNSIAFDAVDAGTIQDKQQRDKLLSNCMAPQSIVLRKGAQVMLIKNIDDSLVNGSIGKVVSFMDERTFDYYDENEEEFLSTQPPVDADGSDGRKGSRLQGFANTGAGNTSQKWPVVRFQIPDGTSRDLLCQRETWKIEQPNGEVLASRAQIPLILAWSLSIHKAQGQTLEKVKVDLTKIFEKGQAYVALSRATTKEGLQVKGFAQGKIQAHPKVRDFYDKLYSVHSIPQTGSKFDPRKSDMYDDDFADLGDDDLAALANMA